MPRTIVPDPRAQRLAEKKAERLVEMRRQTKAGELRIRTATAADLDALDRARRRRLIPADVPFYDSWTAA